MYSAKRVSFPPTGGRLFPKTWRRKLRPIGATLRRSQAEGISLPALQFLFLYVALFFASSTIAMDQQMEGSGITIGRLNILFAYSKPPKKNKGSEDADLLINLKLHDQLLGKSN
jgi:hypothetical protein